MIVIFPKGIYGFQSHSTSCSCTSDIRLIFISVAILTPCSDFCFLSVDLLLLQSSASPPFKFLCRAAFWQNKKTRILFTHESQKHQKANGTCSLKNDAPCLTYVNSDTSLYQNSCGGYLMLNPKHKCSAADSIGTQLPLFNFQGLIFVRGFILSYSEKFVKAFLNNFFAFWK